MVADGRLADDGALQRARGQPGRETVIDLGNLQRLVQAERADDRRGRRPVFFQRAGHGLLERRRPFAVFRQNAGHAGLVEERERGQLPGRDLPGQGRKQIGCGRFDDGSLDRHGRPGVSVDVGRRGLGEPESRLVDPVQVELDAVDGLALDGPPGLLVAEAFEGAGRSYEGRSQLGTDQVVQTRHIGRGAGRRRGLVF